MHATMPAADRRMGHALDEVLHAASGKVVLVVGDTILDEYVAGDVKRISPEAPVPIVEFRERFYLPGGAGNVAANIAALGARPLLAGVAGADADGESLTAALRQLGVASDSLLVDAARPTTVKLRVLAHNQQIVRIDREVRTAIPNVLENALLGWLESNVSRSNACILSDYGKGVVTGRLAHRAIALCRAANVPVLVDPKSLEPKFCRGATVVKPNKHEAERMAGRPMHDEASFLDAGRELAALLEGAALLITRGSLGMSLFRAGMDTLHMPTVARNVYDVTGAGDTVISALAVALAARATLEEAMWLASQCAAIVVAKLGTATVTPEALRSHWRRQPVPDR